MDHATTVENAVKRFYAQGDNETHAWLVQVQASPEAWTFVWQLLDSSKPGEVQFFAATTLYTKISKQWEQVPKSEYLGLQNRILEVLKCPGVSKLALGKLCQALAACIVNFSISQTEKKEKCMVEELTEILPYNTHESTSLLLRVVEAIPKEIIDKQPSVKERKLNESVFNNWCKAVCLLEQIFNTCSQSNDTNSSMLFLSGIQCVLSWLKLGHATLDTVGPIYPYLLIAAGRYLPNRDEDMDSDNVRGWEAVEECLTMVVTHTELYKRPQLFWDWAKSLICMVKEHGAKSFYEVLTAFGEAHSRTFLLALLTEPINDQKWTAQQLIEFLLECSEQEGRYPLDERRSCIPFGFWYALQDDLATLDQPYEQQGRIVLKPIYARLAQALLRKATLPSSPSEAGTPEERELLRCYRQDASDTLSYCYNVLNQDLFILLGQRLSQSHNDVSKWTEIESTIHAFKALSDCNSNAVSHYVAAIMDLMLSHVPYGMYPREVLCCACSAIGDYAEWIGLHPEPWLERSLQLVSLGLTHGPITAPAASMALKDIARECGVHLAPLAPTILETISRTLPNVTPGGGEGLRLMYAAGKLLNSLNTTEEQLKHLDSTLGLCIMRLRELLQLPVNEAQVAVVNQLRMITMFLTTLEGPIGKAVLDALLPIFEGIVNHPEWSRDDTTLEAMHNCATKSLSPLRHSDTEAKPLLTILSTSYRIRPHPAALTFLKQLVLLFGRDPDNAIGPVFSEISGLTLRGVAACRQVGGNLSEMCDLLEAYLNLLAQVCKKNARLLLQIPDQVPELLQCGIACFLLPEPGTVKAAGCFLTHAITQSPHLQTFIQPIGQQLVCVILQCIASGNVVRNNLEPHTEVLLTLNKTCPEWTAQWLRIALAGNNLPVISQAQKESFTQNVLREHTNKRRLYEKLKEFSLQCWQATLGL